LRQRWTRKNAPQRHSSQVLHFRALQPFFRFRFCISQTWGLGNNLHTIPTPCTLHPAPCTLHPKPYSLQPTPHTLHPTTHTLHPTPYTPHPTPYTPHPTPYTLHLTPHTLHPTPYTPKTIPFPDPASRGDEVGCVSKVRCEDRVLDGPASGERGSKSGPSTYCNPRT